jgi:glycosyltransferase involved in cell wall biosynthesis
MPEPSISPSSAPRPWPTITVCICTRDRPRYARDCLAGLARQTADPARYDILVVDSGSAAIVSAALATLVAELGNARMIRVDEPGISRARNAGAAAARGDYIAYIDDDAIPAEDWVAQMLCAIAETGGMPALIGGRILPLWEAPLPGWWPARLRGVLSIIETEGRGPYRGKSVPAGLEPYGTNMVVHVATMRSVGGFVTRIGRNGRVPLSDEDVQLAWRLQDAGYAAHFDSRIVVHHQIQAARLTPDWLLSRMYWQGASSVMTRRLLGEHGHVWWKLPRRLSVALLFLPAALLPRHSARLLALRWRFAYSLGFVRAALARMNA